MHQQPAVKGEDKRKWVFGVGCWVCGVGCWVSFGIGYWDVLSVSYGSRVYGPESCPANLQMISLDLLWLVWSAVLLWWFSYSLSLCFSVWQTSHSSLFRSPSCSASCSSVLPCFSLPCSLSPASFSCFLIGLLWFVN